MRRLPVSLVLAGIAVITAIVFAAEAQPVKVVGVKFVTEAGTPIANQPIVIEATSKARSVSEVLTWLKLAQPAEPYRVMSVTDKQGELRVINLPAGVYSVKMVRLGAEPIWLKQFKLDPGYDMRELKVAVSPEQLGQPEP